MFKMFSQKEKTNQKDVQKAVFKISGMHCVSCGMNIDGELEEKDGVASASTSYAKSVCEVRFDPKKVKEKDLAAVIRKLGYEVDVIL